MSEPGAFPPVGGRIACEARAPAAGAPDLPRLIRDLTALARRQAERAAIVDAAIAGASQIAGTPRVFLLELVPTDPALAHEPAATLAFGAMTLTLYGPDPPSTSPTDADWRALMELVAPGAAGAVFSLVTPRSLALDAVRSPAGRRLVVLPVAGDAARAGSVLALFDIPDGALTDERRLALTTWAGVTALALEQLALREAERRTRLEGEEVRQVALALTGTLDLDAVLARVLAAVQALSGADWASISLVGEQTNFVARHFSTLQTGQAQWYHSPTQLRPGGTSRRVLESREPRFVDDLTTDPESNRAILQLGVRAVATLPLVAHGESVGLLYANFAAPHHFTPREGDLLRALAAQAALAIRNAELYSSLRRSEGELRAVLESQDTGICLTDLAGVIRYANRAFAEIVEVEPGAAIGQPLRPLVERALGRPAFEPGSAPARSDETGPGAMFAAEIELGGARLLYHCVYPAYDEAGAAIGRIYTYQDITELRRLQRVRDDFLATAAHELRTPLSVIRSHAHVLKHLLAAREWPAGEEEPLRNIGTIVDQSAAMSAMVAQFLDVVRLGRAGAREDFAPIDLGDLAARAVEQARGTTARHDIRLLLPAGRSRENLTVRGDAVQLARVLTNLLDNAIKYSPGGGAITVEAYSTPEQVVVAVGDEGLGLTEEQRRNLFARYYQAHGDQSQAYRGLGLGLYLCQEIVERHNGRIEVESAGPGRGSTFILLLPALRPAT